MQKMAFYHILNLPRSTQAFYSQPIVPLQTGHQASTKKVVPKWSFLTSVAGEILEGAIFSLLPYIYNSLFRSLCKETNPNILIYFMDDN
jgi:hypothetical protein